MDCPDCQIPMTRLAAPPASDVYICNNPRCAMNDGIIPSNRSNREGTSQS